MVRTIASETSLKTKLKKITIKTPILTASGTWGHSDELEILDHEIRARILQSLGAYVTKGVTLELRKGNPEFRIVETQKGLLNSIGLQNMGVRHFVSQELPRFLKYELPVIVNISAETVEQFGELAEYLNAHNDSGVLSGIEINVSCPNIKKGGAAFGVNPKEVYRIVRRVKDRLDNRLLIVTKLSPNVTDITEPARAAIDGGTDVLSLINTVRGMAIDINTRKPYLGNITGGLSGPAIKPIGVLMVYECFTKITECRRRKIPIIGIGGISNGRDALEYIMAGATAVAVGTAWFVRPGVVASIHDILIEYIKQSNVKLKNLIGIVHRGK